MVDDLIFPKDSSSSPFMSCKSDPHLIICPPSPCFNSEDERECNATVNNISATRRSNRSSRRSESAYNHKSVISEDRFTRRKLSRAKQLSEQERAESLDFEDLAEISHEQFPDEPSESDSEDNESRAFPNDSRWDKARGQKSVSFGLVRTHKIRQGVDPPSSHTLTESTDCDLTESELCSIDVYELVYKSPTRKSSRVQHRSRTDDAASQKESSSEEGNSSEKIDTHKREDATSGELTTENRVGSYHVIQAVDDACPKEVLLAEDFDFARFKRKTATKFEI